MSIYLINKQGKGFKKEQLMLKMLQERFGEKDLQFHSYFQKTKSRGMECCMLKLITIKFELGNLSTNFAPNCVEPINKMLKVESGKEKPLHIFVEEIQSLVAHQSRNIALIDQCTQKLHPNLYHMLPDENVLYNMGVDECKQYKQVFVESDLLGRATAANNILEGIQIRSAAIDRDEELGKTVQCSQVEDNNFDHMSDQMRQIPVAQESNILSYLLNVLADAAACRLTQI